MWRYWWTSTIARQITSTSSPIIFSGKNVRQNVLNPSANSWVLWLQSTGSTTTINYRCVCVQLLFRGIAYSLCYSEVTNTTDSSNTNNKCPICHNFPSNLLLLCVSQFYVFFVLRSRSTRTKVSGVTSCYYTCKVSSASTLCACVSNLFLWVSRIISVTVELTIQLTHQISLPSNSSNTNNKCHVTEITQQPIPYAHAAIFAVSWLSYRIWSFARRHLEILFGSYSRVVICIKREKSSLKWFESCRDYQECTMMVSSSVYTNLRYVFGPRTAHFLK